MWIYLMSKSYNQEAALNGAKTVPRKYANKNMTNKNNDFMLFSAIKRIENTTKNAIQIP